VIGGSGSGKSVLLKCILGLLQPDAGTIKVDGEETTVISDGARTRVMRKFGMLFQSGALFDSLRVWENVAFGPIQSDGMAPTRPARWRSPSSAPSDLRRDRRALSVGNVAACRSAWPSPAPSPANPRSSSRRATTGLDDHVRP